ISSAACSSCGSASTASSGRWRRSARSSASAASARDSSRTRRSPGSTAHSPTSRPTETTWRWRRNDEGIGVDEAMMTALAHTPAPARDAFTVHDALDLLDWKRRIFALYEQVRAFPDPETAWNLWRETRVELYRTHPQSPLPAHRRAGYGNAFFPYDPAYRVVGEIRNGASRPSALPASTGGTFAFTRIGRVCFTLLGEERELELS